MITIKTNTSVLYEKPLVPIGLKAKAQLEKAIKHPCSTELSVDVIEYLLDRINADAMNYLLGER